MVIVLLVALNIYWVSKYKVIENKSSELQGTVITQSQSYTNEIDFLNRYIESITLKSKLSLETKRELAKKDIELIKQAEAGSKLFFFYKKDACGACLAKIYQDLSILSDNIGADKILILTTLDLETNLIDLKKEGFEVLPIDTLGLKFEEFNQPFLFVLDESLGVHFLYAPELFDNFRNEYFTKVLPEYFNNM